MTKVISIDRNQKSIKSVLKIFIKLIRKDNDNNKLIDEELACDLYYKTLKMHFKDKTLTKTEESYISEIALAIKKECRDYSQLVRKKGDFLYNNISYDKSLCTQHLQNLCWNKNEIRKFIKEYSALTPLNMRILEAILCSVEKKVIKTTREIEMPSKLRIKAHMKLAKTIYNISSSNIYGQNVITLNNYPIKTMLQEIDRKMQWLEQIEGHGPTDIGWLNEECVKILTNLQWDNNQISDFKNTYFKNNYLDMQILRESLMIIEKKLIN